MDSVTLDDADADRESVDLEVVSDRCAAVLDGVADAVVADRSVLEAVLVGFVAGGHVLLEGAPGTGKSLTARCFARALGRSFSRVRLTPETSPADVTGAHVVTGDMGTFELRPGPLFADVVLADGIDRSPPGARSVLFEAMEEGEVSVRGETYDLPDGFFLVATGGHAPDSPSSLSTAGADRFLVGTDLGYPDEEGELALLDRRAEGRNRAAALDPAFAPADAGRLRAAPEVIYVDPDVRRYIVELVRATRDDGRVRTGASPRGTEGLFETSRARACVRGRGYATPSDVDRMAPAVLAHRIALTDEARAGGTTPDAVVHDALDDVPVPT